MKVRSFFDTFFGWLFYGEKTGFFHYIAYIGIRQIIGTKREQLLRVLYSPLISGTMVKPRFRIISLLKTSLFTPNYRTNSNRCR